MNPFRHIKELVNAFKGDSYQAFNTMRTEIPSYSRTEMNIETYFKGTAAACIRKRATKIAGIEAYPAYMRGDQLEAQPGHWFNELITEPNTFTQHSFYDIKELIVQWLDFNGNAYIWTPSNGNKTPVQMWVLPSNMIKIIPDNSPNRESLIKAYAWRTSMGTDIFLEPKDICHIKTPSPDTKMEENFYYGRPVIKNAITSEILGEKKIVDNLIKFIDNEAMPVFAVSVPQKIQQQNWEFKKKMIRDMLGYKAPVMVLEGNEKLETIKTMGEFWQDLLKSNNSTLDLVKKICRAFEVPYPLISGEFQNRATAEVIHNEFNISTIEPLHKRIDQRFTAHFRQWDQNLYITHIADEYIDPDQFRADNDMLFRNNGIMQNELREAYGYDRVKDGDRFLFELTSKTDNNQDNTDIQIDENIDENTDEKSLKKKDENYKYWKALDDLVKPHREKIRSNVSDTFKDLEKDVLKEMQSQVKEYGKAFNSQHMEYLRAKDLVYLKDLFPKFMWYKLSTDINPFNLQKWGDEIEKRTSKSVRNLVIEMIKDSLRQANENYDQTDWEKRQSKLTKNSTGKIRDSINTIHKDLKKQIQSIIEANPFANADTLLEKITEMTSSKFGGNYTKARAETIATTTATFTTGEAQNAVWRDELGFGTEWISQRDGKVRKTHRQADGQRADEEGYYYVGTDQMKHPGGGSEAEENANCRCYQKAVKK